MDWPGKLLIGGATGLLLELIFVGLAYLISEEAAFGVAPLVVGLNFPALGYILQVYRGTLRWELGALPEWESWPVLMRGGLAGFAIGLAYGVIPLLQLLLGLHLLVRGGVMLFLGMVLMALGILAGLFTLFFVPMALARYLGQRRIEAAFHPGTLWGGINEVLAEYVATYLLGVGSFILASLVALIPYLGGLIWPFLWFYLMLVQARLFGEICAKAA
jgi:small basic protein